MGVRHRPHPGWQPPYRYCWDHPAHVTADGESHDALAARVTAALAAVRDEPPDGGVTVVGSHGTWVSRALHGLGLPVDVDFWFAMPMPAIYAVTYDRDRVAVVTGPGLVGRSAAGVAR